MKNSAPNHRPAPDFAFLFESLPALYLVLTPDLLIAGVSDAYLAATMTRRGDIIGRHIFDVFPDNPNDPAAEGTRMLSASFDRVFKTRQPDIMAIQKYDIRKPAEEGGAFEERYWKPVNSPLPDKTGKIAYIVHHVEDVTKTVRHNQRRDRQLRESELKLKSLIDTVLDTIVDGVITLNKNGTIQSYNKACVQLFGHKPEEALGQDISILIPGFGPQGTEMHGRRKDGSLFPIELAIGETDQGGEHASVAIIRDLSERYEVEKSREHIRQAQKMEAIGQLTGGIAHDFNNLLAIILGNLDYLNERVAAEDPLMEFITPSIRAAEHGSELTQQLLAFGRKQALQPRVISINELLKYLTTLLKHTLGKHITIRIAPADGLWPVSVDVSQLQNALLNLAVNARDAMPRGGKLTFETQNSVLDAAIMQDEATVAGDYVMIAVSDTGEGMSPDVIAKAFEPFFTTKDIGKGSGLGLSMVYGFVRQSAGHIKIESEPGKGTTLRIYLPKADAAAPAQQPAAQTPDEEKQPKLVLVVEDNKNVLKLTSSMVTALGYRVLLAETGDEAMKIIEEQRDIDLLLTDVMLPGALNGPGLAKRAMALRPGMKVLFNSGYAEHAIMRSGLLDEGVHLISKPFRKHQLANKIAEVMKQSAVR